MITNQPSKLCGLFLIHIKFSVGRMVPSHIVATPPRTSVATVVASSVERNDQFLTAMGPSTGVTSSQSSGWIQSHGPNPPQRGLRNVGSTWGFGEHCQKSFFLLNDQIVHRRQEGSGDTSQRRENLFCISGKTSGLDNWREEGRQQNFLVLLKDNNKPNLVRWKFA